MRKIEVIFSQADKELTERLRRRHKKLADIYLALVCIFKIITVIILCGMLYFMTLNKSSYAVTAVWITFISAIISLLISFIFNTMYNNLTIEHWLPQTIIVGIIITSLATCAGIIDNNNSKVKKSIENTIASNYDNVLDYHNYKDNKTFVSGDSKYTFYYDKGTKTLIVLKGSDVDAVFVDGVKQKGEK